MVGIDPTKRRRDRLLNLLWDVHDRAQVAAHARDHVLEAIMEARIAGASPKQLSAVSGLSEAAMQAYLAGWNRRSLNPDEFRRVGRPPDHPRPPDEMLDTA